ERELGGIAGLEGCGRAAASGFETTSVILAGQVPMPTLLALLSPLLLRSPVLAKAAARDPVTPRIAARAIAEVDSGLGRALAVVAFPGEDAELAAALLEAECVVATGSDATIEAVRARVRGARRLVVHGHRLSLAALGPGATRGAALHGAAAGLALDVAL